MIQPVAIITGAGGGIGSAAATALCRRGYRLALLGRTARKLEATAKTLPVPSLVLPTDLAEPDQLKTAVLRTVEGLGRLDAVIHCAGYAPVLSIEQTTPKQWRTVLDINLGAAVHLARLAWPFFKKARQGVLVNISSAAAHDPFPGFAAYASAKAGLHLLGLSLARKGAPLGIRVHTIAPGAVETPMFRSILTEEQFPREKTLSPDDVAAVIAQCVDGSLIYTSGEVIYMKKPS